MILMHFLYRYDKMTYNEVCLARFSSDKNLIRIAQLKDYYMHNVVEKAYPFLQSTQARVTDAISNLIALYAKCVTGGDTILAQKQLRLTQREQVSRRGLFAFYQILISCPTQIVWERDTVWRQMIGKERRGETDGPPKGLGTLLQLEADPLIAVPTPVGRFRITGKRISRLIAIAVFVALLNIEVLDQVEANHCFAILVFATILWATEV
jgi:phosphate transporter